MSTDKPRLGHGAGQYVSLRREDLAGVIPRPGTVWEWSSVACQLDEQDVLGGARSVLSNLRSNSLIVKRDRGWETTSKLFDFIYEHPDSPDVEAPVKGQEQIVEQSPPTRDRSKEQTSKPTPKPQDEGKQSSINSF